MADFEGFEIETPQEVMARINQSRSDALGKATQSQARQINIQRSVDLVFGNQEERIAEVKTAAVKNALADAKEDSIARGLSEDESQLVRLQAVRDATETIDPGLSMQMDEKIGALQNKQLARSKLKQGMELTEQEITEGKYRYVLNPDTLVTEAIDISTPEGRKLVQEKRMQGLAVSETEGGLVNLFNAERSRAYKTEMDTLAAASAKEQAAMKAAGENLALTTSTKTYIQKHLDGSRQVLDQYHRVGLLLKDPEVLRMLPRLKNFSMTVKDLTGLGGFTPGQIEKYRKLIGLIANAQGAANRITKVRAGTAVSASEQERLRHEIAGINDSPIKFMEKVNEYTLISSRANRRMTEAVKANNFEILNSKGSLYADDEADTIFGPASFSDLGGTTPVQREAVSTMERLTAPSAPPQPVSGGNAPSPMSAMDIINREMGK